jgi:uncharacterized protein YecE (DUF72 family)
LPASSGNLSSGTAGWTDPTLLKSGLFYPKNASSARTRLEFYSQHFSMVEVDATYYALMDPNTVRRWCDATPADFTFNIKAHPVLTGHPIDVRRLPRDLRSECEKIGLEERVYPRKLPEALRQELERRFFHSLEPLVESGKLGAILVQYPPWFSATRGNAKTIEQLRVRYPTSPLAVEFRHKSWLAEPRRERVWGLLEDNELSYVCVDEPPGPAGGLPPAVRVTTEALALIRFHGQNQAGWAMPGASVHERFNYLYSEKELSAWVKPVKQLCEQAQRVHAVFNNCVRNYAVLGAKGLVVLLGVSPDPC